MTSPSHKDTDPKPRAHEVTYRREEKKKEVVHEAQNKEKK